MRTVLIGWSMVALAGCDLLESLGGAGVCVSEGEVDTRCTESLNGRDEARRQCDEDTSEFIEGKTCADLGYSDLCLEEEDLLLYGGSREECVRFDDTT